MRRWMQLALSISRKAIHKNHQLGAVLVRGGQVLATAANISRPLENANRGHAEERCIKCCADPTGATLFVARSNGRVSKPCPHCMDIIRRAGIRAIVYVDLDGYVVIDRVNAMMYKEAWQPKLGSSLRPIKVGTSNTGAMLAASG